MTTPRIGDTIHYTPHFGEPHCHAAIVTQCGDDEIAVRVLDPTSTNDYTAYPVADPNRPVTSTRGDGWETEEYHPDQRTPGTWHPIH